MFFSSSHSKFRPLFMPAPALLIARKCILHMIMMAGANNLFKFIIASTTGPCHHTRPPTLSSQPIRGQHCEAVTNKRLAF